MIKIEVLYFDGCPHHQAAVELARKVAREEQIAAEVVEVRVSDESAARALCFLGSPTIRVNGVDVEPAARNARDYGMMCRTYLVNGHRQGLPSAEMVRRALREAAGPCCAPEQSPGEGESANKAPVLLAGSVLAAVVASFCCILPILFAITGISVLGASALFAAWRPYLLGITFALLGLGFYFAYRRPKGACAPGSACAVPSGQRSGRVALWVITAAVVMFAAFPYYSGFVATWVLGGAARASSGGARPAVTPLARSGELSGATTVRASFEIEGMDCSGCAKAIENKLREIPGVRRATVLFEQKRAEVEFDPAAVSPDRFEKAIAEAGYHARKV